MDDLRWDRALLNGLLVWFVSVAIYVVPAIVYGFWQMTSLRSQPGGMSALGQQVAQIATSLYQESLVLLLALVLITALLTFWRARVVARGTWNLRWANGLLVGAVPAILSLLFVLCGGLDWWDAVTSAIYLVGGLLGGITARPT
jgi:hypothetical protein